MIDSRSIANGGNFFEVFCFGIFLKISVVGSQLTPRYKSMCEGKCMRRNTWVLGVLARPPRMLASWDPSKFGSITRGPGMHPALRWSQPGAGCYHCSSLA